MLHAARSLAHTNGQCNRNRTTKECMLKVFALNRTLRSIHTTRHLRVCNQFENPSNIFSNWMDFSKSTSNKWMAHSVPINMFNRTFGCLPSDRTGAARRRRRSNPLTIIEWWQKRRLFILDNGVQVIVALWCGWHGSAGTRSTFVDSVHAPR